VTGGQLPAWAHSGFAGRRRHPRQADELVVAVLEVGPDVAAEVTPAASAVRTVCSAVVDAEDRVELCLLHAAGAGSCSDDELAGELDLLA